MNPSKASNLGQLIIELIDVNEVSDAESISHCFADLAETNKAQFSQIINQAPLQIHAHFF